MVLFIGYVFMLLTAGSAAQALSVEAESTRLTCNFTVAGINMCDAQSPISKSYRFFSDLTPEAGEEERRVRKLCADTDSPAFLGFTNIFTPADVPKCRKVAIPTGKADGERITSFKYGERIISFKFRLPKGTGEMNTDGGANCVRTLSLGVYKPLDPANERGLWVRTGTIRDYITIDGTSCQEDTHGEQDLAIAWATLKYLEEYLQIHGVYPSAPPEGIVVNGKCLDHNGFGDVCDWDSPSAYSMGLPPVAGRQVYYYNDINGCRVEVMTTTLLTNHGLTPGVQRFDCDYFKQAICNE